MGKVKLTEAQRRVLQRLKDGDALLVARSFDRVICWEQGGGPTPSFRTILRLENELRYIERYDRELTGHKYRITPAGLSALEDEKDGNDG